jgi:Tfp pilus assembly protein PilN
LVEVFPSLSEITPADIRLTELIIKPTTVSLAGTTLSQTSLNLLINNIQLSPKFFNVAVDRIETSEEKNGGLFFRINAATVKPETKGSSQKNAEKVNILDRTQGL